MLQQTWLRDSTYKRKTSPGASRPEHVNKNNEKQMFIGMFIASVSYNDLACVVHFAETDPERALQLLDVIGAYWCYNEKSSATPWVFFAVCLLDLCRAEACEVGTVLKHAAIPIECRWLSISWYTLIAMPWMIIMSVHNPTLFKPRTMCRGPEHLDSCLRVTHLQFHQPRVLSLKSCCTPISQTANVPTMLCKSRNPFLVLQIKVLWHIGSLK